MLPEITRCVFISPDFIVPPDTLSELAGMSTVVCWWKTGCQKIIEPVLSLLRYKINLVGIDLSTNSIDKCRY